MFCRECLGSGSAAVQVERLGYGRLIGYHWDWQ